MKIQKITTIIAICLAVAIVTLSGIMKLMGGAEVKATMAKIGMAEHTIKLGVMEIVFAQLFIYRPTYKIGFILLACYFAGALAVEIGHGMSLNALLPATFVWVAALLRDKSIFIPQSAKVQIS
jgi:hypothetical protein